MVTRYTSTGMRSAGPESRVVAAVRTHYESSGAFVSTERSLGWGRADLVVFRLDADKCRARFANGQFRALDRADHYRALRCIPDVETGADVSLSVLCAQLGRSPSYVRGALVSFLERAGYVKRVRPATYAKVNGFIPIAREVIGVEAKVSDWRKGAMQAKRHRSFANRVYLALAAEFVHRVRIDVLRRHGIGLLSVAHGVVTEVLESPEHAPLDPDRHSFSAEWLWRYRRPAVLKAAGCARE
jgi:hypothetical protein